MKITAGLLATAFNPFKFIIYSEWARAGLVPVE
jgi:hypothetical protein